LEKTISESLSLVAWPWLPGDMFVPIESFDMRYLRAEISEREASNYNLVDSKG